MHIFQQQNFDGYWNMCQVRESEQEKGELLFGTVETWLIWKLTKGRVHVTDYSNASRTMLFNINELKWDEEILAELNIPKSMLPEVKPSSCIYGEADPSFFGAPISIGGAAGDQQAALFGQTCFSPGEAKKYVWNGMFFANEYRRKTSIFQQWTRNNYCMGAQWKSGVCIGGVHFYCRCGNSMAAG